MSDVSHERAAAVRLVRLPGLGSRRLRRLLGECADSNGSASELLARLRDDRPPVALERVIDVRLGESADRLWSSWRVALFDDFSRISDDEIGAASSGTDVLVWGSDEYPAILAGDPEAPPVLFVRGDREALTAIDISRRVAVVGTRRGTEYGRGVASDLGRDLATHGVAVVSGLALGIDAAAHRGVLAARQRGAVGRPIGVVASGLDVVYPRSHGGLWEQVASSGVLLTESPPGTAPDRFRFPLRNRIIAALSEVVVVVESRRAGGSMITVDEAMKRDVTVMAVPGSTRSRASEGVNQLIQDGASVATTAADVLMVLGLGSTRVSPWRDPREPPRIEDRVVLDQFDREPRSLESLVRDLPELDLGRIALSVGRLESAGWLACTDGWYERVWSPWSR